MMRGKDKRSKACVSCLDVLKKNYQTVQKIQSQKYATPDVLNVQNKKKNYKEGTYRLKRNKPNTSQKFRASNETNKLLLHVVN